MLPTSDAKSMQSAKIADDSPHQGSSPEHASTVSVESDSIWTLLHPRRLTKHKPSIIAIASAAAAEVALDKYTVDAATNFLEESRTTAPTDLAELSG
jgi:hypothetical protein